MSNKTVISIVNHTEKSFAVFTNKLQKYQESLTNLGGVFDASITNKETGDIFMGWIFYIDRKVEIQNWINECYLEIQKPKKQRFEQVLFPPKTNNCFKKITLSPVITTEGDRIKSIEKTLEMLIIKIGSIEAENNMLTTRINGLEVELNLLRENNKISSNVEEEYEIFEQTDIDDEEQLTKSIL
jgi:hypothetical protein